MAKSVTTIPATLSRFTAAPINSTKKRRDSLAGNFSVI